MAEARYNLTNIGRVELGADYIKCDFVIDSNTFSDRFNDILGELSRRDRKSIEKSIDGKSVEKIRDPESVRSAFKKIENKLMNQQIEKRINPSTSSDTYATSERKETRQIDESDIIKIPVEIRETIKAHFSYNFLAINQTDEEEDYYADSDQEIKEDDTSVDTDEEDEEEEDVAEEQEEYEEAVEEEGKGIHSKLGIITIKNTAEEKAIWDIVGEIETEVPIDNLDHHLELKRLGPNEEKTYEYELTEAQKPQLKVKEFISTINDAEKLTYSLNIDQENHVLFKISLENPEDTPVNNIIIEKTLFSNYTEVVVHNASIGNYSTDEGKLRWEIEELSANSKAEIEFNIGVQVNDKSEKVRSGTIEISYNLPETQSKLKINDFNAYGDNNVMISDEQLEEQPDMYRSSFFFENLSPYTAKVLSIEIQEPNAENNLVTLPSDELLIQPGNSWESEAWEIDTQGEIPQYTKDVQFTLLHQLTGQTSMFIAVEDIELAVAMFEAGIKYDLDTIESHRQVPFNATHTLVNGGAAPFDYLSIEHKIQEHFIPPKKEEMIFKKNGKVIDIPPEYITITPDTYDSEGVHEIYVELDNLREMDIGMFEPNDELTIEYPVIADRLSAEEEFITNARWTANTYPRGEPIVIEEIGETEGTVIQVLHERIKLLRGKSVHATGEPDVYEVILKVRNNSSHVLENYEIRDRIPKGFDFLDPSLEVSETEKLEGREVKVWMIEKIELDEKIEINYKIRAKKENALASEAQFSM